MAAPRDGTLTDLHVRHNGSGGNGNDVTYTVQVDDVDTGLTLALASGAVGQASDVVNSVAVTKGQRVDIIVEKAASVGANPGPVVATINLRSPE
jgi:hypothetical protein